MFGMSRPNYHFNYGNQGHMIHQAPNGYLRNQRPFVRTQPFPYQAPLQHVHWNSFQQQGPFHPQGFQPLGQTYQPGLASQSIPYHLQKDGQFLFQNPLQPKEEMVPKPFMPLNGYPIMNPYPKQSFIPKQPSGMQSLMNSFKSQDGSVDFNKMMNTAGQMVNAVTQVSSLVKGFGGIFKA